MKLLFPVAALVLALAPAAFADASFSRPTALRILIAAGEPTFPPDWAGVWQYEDTIRTCGAKEFSTESGEDILCTGNEIEPDPEFTCDGTVTATVVDVMCTGSYEAFPGCTANVTSNIQGTRDGDTIHYVNTVMIEFTGPDLECSFLPDICQETRGVLTRIGPEPKECVTPTTPSTWGSVKSRYR